MKIELSKVSFEEKDNIGYILINDPPANKMTGVFLKEFIDIVRNYVAKSKVKGIIISGNGRHYSSGADVEELKEIIAVNSKMDNNNLISFPTWYQENRTTFNFFESHDIPVISAIKGMCIGSGMELALCSHIRICANGSTLGLPESTFGFLPGLTGTFRYLEVMGLGKAIELILSGETLSAEEAREFGLVDCIVNKKEILNYCEELMKYIVHNEVEYSKERIEEYIENFNEIYTMKLI